MEHILNETANTLNFDMDSRRSPRAVIDPKVRQVGFTTPHHNSTPVSNPDPSVVFSSSSQVDSQSPVMIAPTLPDASLPRPVPIPARRQAIAVSAAADILPVGSYNPADSLLATSPAPSPASKSAEGVESEVGSLGWFRTNSGKSGAASLGFSMSGINSVEEDSAGEGYSAVKGADVALSGHVENDACSKMKPTKEKMTKAERRALQEAQRAAKAEAQKSISGKASAAQTAVRQSREKKEAHAGEASSALVDKKGSDFQVEKDRRRDVLPPRMLYDNKKREEKGKKWSIVKQTDVKNSVELFQHLPQYARANQLQYLQAEFFLHELIHPAVYKVGLQHVASNLTGANARCIAMLLALKETIKDYSSPAKKVYIRDLTTRISSQISFLSQCRPLSISMGNAIRYLKSRIAKLPLALSDIEARTSICEDIDCFVNEKILIAAKVIAGHAASKIRDNDVLLVFGCSSIVEMILLHAHDLGKKFHVVIIDSRPKQKGQTLARRLVSKGLQCTYSHLNAVSYIMPEVTMVLLGASSVLSNGTAYAKIGTACVAMVANAFRVPVLFCCEAYKFHERVQLDSICSNELGDPDMISKVPGRIEVNCLENWKDADNLLLLNLSYDITPSDYISVIVTEYGLVPPTSVPVIVREYSKEHFLV